jgi:polyisoprenoid-binding protein YceI
MSSVDTQVLPTGSWLLDKVHSSIGFAVDYMAGSSTERSATSTPPSPMGY